MYRRPTHGTHLILRKHQRKEIIQRDGVGAADEKEHEEHRLPSEQNGGAGGGVVVRTKMKHDRYK